MKNFSKISIGTSLLLLFALLTGCRDDFAEMNTDKDAVTEGDPTYLMAQAVLAFEPSDYTYWFYNAVDFYNDVQFGVPTGSVTESVVDGSEQQGYKSTNVLNYYYAVDYERSLMTEEESAQYENVSSAIQVLAIYLGIMDTDFCGDIPYTEAAQARYGGTLTPKYDHVSDLYDLWLNQLDSCVTAFTTNENQIEISTQDQIYNGDWSKWAKLANSLKLKIAARLISQDMERAKEIATAVVTNPCGIIDGESEDFLFHKGDQHSSSNDYVYHWNNDVLTSIAPSKSFADFMVNNQDPRVRFIYTKNEWNSKVVDLFLAAGRKSDIPDYIMDNVELETVDGKEQFKAWKGLGEPWVRYYGLPLAFNANANTAQYGDWFDYTNQCRYDANYTYRPYSMFQEEMIRGRKDFTLPVTPNSSVIEDTEDVPWYGMYLTTAEVNLYLAEFALYGASGLQSASYYFDKAVRASVEEYDRLASLNKIPYYGTNYGYDPHEKTIDLCEGEIDQLMQHAAYQLTGNTLDDLEKVYLQQIIHFTLQPIDLFVTGRRSGCPKFGSSLIAREDYAANQIPATYYPRRTAVTEPSPTDLMYDNTMSAYEYQGFSTVPGNGILNSERVWQDKDAPQWGEGPLLK